MPLQGDLEASAGAVENLTKNLADATGGINNFAKIYKEFGSSIINGDKGIDNITNSFKSMTKSVEGFSNIFAKLQSALPVSDGLREFITSTSTFSVDSLKALGQSAELMKSVMGVFDARTEGLREADKAMMDLTKSFGAGIEEARLFTDSLPSSALTDLGKAAFLSTTELKDSLLSAKSYSIGLDQLSESLESSYGELNIFTAAVLQADASGQTIQTTMNYLNSIISKQGGGVQEAAEIYAGFSEVARETGINFSTVANTLTNTANNMSKLGMTADYGRPILEVFAKTVKDVGLGIDVATDSTSSLVSALGSLTTNYGLAYFTQLKSGLSDGAASASLLGSSIEMRGRMLDAEKTGDQSSIALEMANALKDTISSMTGSDIITLEQARRDESLQSKFYMQEQMLSQYGISDIGTQDRVLEMLEKIDEAGSYGNVDAQKELAMQLNTAIEGRDSTFSEMKKANIETGSMLAQLQTELRESAQSSREVAEMIRQGYSNNIVESLTDNIKAGFSAVDEAIAGGLVPKLKEFDLSDYKDFNEVFKDIAGKFEGISEASIGAAESLKDSADSIGESIRTAITSAFSKISIKIDASPDLQELLSARATGGPD